MKTLCLFLLLGIGQWRRSYGIWGRDPRGSPEFLPKILLLHLPMSWILLNYQNVLQRAHYRDNKLNPAADFPGSLHYRFTTFLFRNIFWNVIWLACIVLTNVTWRIDLQVPRFTKADLNLIQLIKAGREGVFYKGRIIKGTCRGHSLVTCKIGKDGKNHMQTHFCWFKCILKTSYCVNILIIQLMFRFAVICRHHP